MCVNKHNLQHEQQCDNNHARAEVAETTGTDFHHAVRDKAQRNTFGNGEAERHHHGGNKRRNGFGQVIPLHAWQAGGHQHPNVDQRARGCVARHHARQRRQENHQQEQNTHDNRRQACTTAHGNAGGRFDVGRHGRGTDKGTGYRGDAIDKQRLLHARELTFRISQARFIGHADQGTGGVEQVYQHEGEDNARQTKVKRPGQIDMAHDGSNARRRGDNTAVMHIAQHPAQQGGHDDRDQHRRVNIARSQNGDNKEAQHAQQHAVWSQVTNGNQRVLVCDNHASIFQAHHADEQTDTAGDTDAQAHGDIGNHPVADAENGQQQQADSAPENGAHPYLPRQAHRLHNHEREEGVQTHRWRQRHRQVSKYAHQDTAERRNQTGGHEHRAGVHSGHAKNLRVYKHDVDHRQEGGETGDHFGACRRAVLAQFKHALQYPLAGSRGGVLLTHYQFPQTRKENSSLSYTKMRQ